jgi:tetratricopeptide (TPR) repeat protein
LNTYDAYVAAPESLITLSRLYARQGQTLAAQSLQQAALAASPSEETRSNTAAFLIDHGWNVLASRECRATLARANANPDADDVNARLRLSSLAAMRGDDAQAAVQLRTALEDHKISGGELTMARGDRVVSGAEAEAAMQIEVAQYALHAAQAKGDAAEVGRQVDELMRLGTNDAEAVLDLVPELRARGRGGEADKLFRSVYAPLRARFDGGETDPSLMNEIAWLCARCDEHLDEALDLSNRAVAAQPQSAAFLDTNAEAHFRKGQAAEAARLETMALKFQPGDPFMEGQLKRFQAGTKK